jgi:hypothetical protein
MTLRARKEAFAVRRGRIEGRAAGRVGWSDPGAADRSRGPDPPYFTNV